MRKLLVTGFLFFHLCGTGQPYPFKYYPIENLHFNQVVKGIIKDPTGFVWVATDDGVVRYNNYETEIFVRGLSSQYTKKFLLLHDGRLIVLSDFGVQEIAQKGDSLSFTPLTTGGIRLDQTLNYPKSIYQDKTSTLWIGEISAVVRIGEKGVTRFNLGVDYQSISYHRSFSFAEDAFGTLWIAPYKGQLLFFDEKMEKLVAPDLELPLTEVSGISVINGDYLLVSGKEGFIIIKVDSGRRILEVNFFQDIQNISAVEQFEDLVFLGTWDQGVWYFDFASEPFVYRKIPDLNFNDILDFYYDTKEQELWVAGSENVGVLKRPLITPLGETGKYRIESQTPDDSGRLYISTGEEIYLQNLQDSEKSLILTSRDTYFNSIVYDEGTLWIGDYIGRIFSLNTKNGRMQTFRDSTNSPVNFILADHSGNKWFLGDSEAITRISREGHLRQYPVKNALVIKQSPSGDLFCGASGKVTLLTVYDSVSETFDRWELTYRDPVSENIRLEDLVFLGDDLYLATNEGVFFAVRKGPGYIIEKINLGETLKSGLCKAIAWYEEKLWVATSEGLLAFDGTTAVQYTTSDGLPSKLIKQRGFLISNHFFTIATAKGLGLVSRETSSFKPTPPPVFKAVVINGERFSETDTENSIELPYKSSIQAEYFTLSYPGENIEYSTRVRGLEENWSAPSQNRYLSFLGFTEGDYTLEVRAKNTGRIWSEPLTFEFKVLRPWFRTWWAYLLFTLGLVGLILLFNKIYHYNLINQKKRLQRLVEKGTEEINRQKNEIIEQKNRIIEQKEELLEKNEAVYKTQQALTETDLKYLKLKEKQLQDEIEYRNKQITTHTLNIIQKNESLLHLRKELEKVVKNSGKGSQADLRKTLKMIDESFRLDKDWEDFKLYFEQIYTGFYAKLKINCPDLTNQELRHCALIRLNLSISECASILGISPESVKVSRARIRKKLTLDPGKGLTDFVLSI